MKRRIFIRNAALATAGLYLGRLNASPPAKKITHILTLSFDDGFRNSFIKTAELYEKYNLKACFNVITSAHLPTFTPPDQYMPRQELGDFQLWNEFVSRGHEVMPHGWAHNNLTKMPVEMAKGYIEKSLDYFSAHLNGFNPEKAVFVFPFNASTPELNQWAVTKVRAVRTIVRGNPVNPMPDNNLRVIDCNSHGPENIDKVLDDAINKFLKSAGGWFVYNTHGLDEEGWGPMTSSYLDRLLAKLVKIKTLEILPAGMALAKFS